MWRVEYLRDAVADIKKLDYSQRLQVVKAINKVAVNPLPQAEDGYGKPLGNKSG
jgi:mRNA interferase RelE/StbE